MRIDSKMTPEHIKAARKEGFVLADFGRGFFPAVWSPFTKYWVVAEPWEDQPLPGKRLMARTFNMYPILREKATPMLEWIQIPTIENIDRNHQLIKQLVDALESALEYVLYFKPEDIEYDLTDIDDALSAGRDFLRNCNSNQPISPRA